LENLKTIDNVDWQKIEPDKKYVRGTKSLSDRYQERDTALSLMINFWLVASRVAKAPRGMTAFSST
jgi:hypothetical protein